MSNTRLRAADLADEFRFISSDKRMEYVPARANHLLIAADMLDANDELLMRLNAEYCFRQNIAAENTKLRELVRDMWQFTGTACKKYPRLFDQSAQGGQMVMPNMLDSFEQRMRELGVGV